MVTSRAFFASRFGFLSGANEHKSKLEEVAGEYCAAFVVDLIRKVKQMRSCVLRGKAIRHATNG
jgi:hypothetical protein